MSPFVLGLVCLGLGGVVEPTPPVTDEVVDVGPSTSEAEDRSGLDEPPPDSGPLPSDDVADAGAPPSDVDGEPGGEAETALLAEADGEPEGEPEPEPEPTSTSEPVTTHDVPADDFEQEPGLAPGGYHGHGVILEREPPDGRKQIVVGTLLVPLGTLAAVSSGVGAWLYAPAHCQERLAAVGTTIEDPEDCRGTFTLNAIRTTTGVLMLASGATILAIGLVKRQRYREWRARHGMRASRRRFAPRLRLDGMRVRF